MRHVILSLCLLIACGFQDAIAAPVEIKPIQPYGAFAATTTNINVATLSGLPLTIGGGVFVSVAQKLLLTGQTDTTENGLWEPSGSGAWNQGYPTGGASSDRPIVVPVSSGDMARSICQSPDWTDAGITSTWTCSPLTLPGNMAIYHTVIGNAVGGLNLGGSCFLTSPGVACSGTEQALAIADRIGTARGFQCLAAAGPGASRTGTFTARKNGTNTSMTCGMTGAAVSCTSAATFAVAAGDWFSITDAEPLLSGMSRPVCSFIITN